MALARLWYDIARRVRYNSYVLNAMRFPDAGRRPSGWRQIAVLLFLVCAAWLAFAWALLAQHRSLHSRAYDLGYFDQVIWNTAHGRWFETNFVPFNFLGEHFSPVLLVFAALYRLGGNIETVLFLQAGAAALAAIPLFLGTRRVLASETAALLVAVAYLLAAELHAALLFDFHPELFGIAAVFSTFALLVHRRPGWALAALLPVFLLKEDALMVGLGYAWLFWHFGYRRHASALLGGTLLYGALVLGWLMPAIRGDAPSLMDRYAYLGESLPQIIGSALLHPEVIWAQLSTAVAREALTRLLAGTALLPLASPAALLALPVTAANLLSTHEVQSGLYLHYVTYPLALTFVGAVLGAASLARAGGCAARGWAALRVPPRARVVLLAALLLGTQTAAWASRGPFGGAFDLSVYRITPHVAAVQRVIAHIPPDAPLSAQSNLLPHLSRRAWLRDFPRLDGVDFVLVDQKTWGLWQTTGEIYQRVLTDLPSLGFCLIYEDDGVQLYTRQGVCPAEGPAVPVVGQPR